MPNNSDKNVLNAFMIWKKDGVNFRGWNWSKRTNVKEDMGVLDLEVSGAVSGVRNKVQWLKGKKLNWDLYEAGETPSSNNTGEDSTHGHHQTLNTEIRLIIFFAATDGEALYSQQKQDQELTVAQIMNS